MASPAAGTSQASIEFREVPDDATHWSFTARHLPGVDPSGAVVVGHISHGNIATSIGLTMRWLEVGKPERSVEVLDESEVSDLVYNRDSPPAEIQKLAGDVRARLAEVNRALEATELRPMVACEADGLRVTCGDFARVLDEKALGWQIAPMQIGEGPISTMVSHVLEAHWDPQTKQLAVLIDHRCQNLLGDACFLPEKWTIVRLD